jgi:type I restriction enzyme S subunit
MHSLITENFDIWTSAKASKSNGGRGKSSTNGKTIYGIKKLRELILELAICGKLVPQDPNDEPACILLKKIYEEKKLLLDKGKIKKQKALPKIKNDEKVFKLPTGWEWVKLGDVADFINGYAFKSSDFIETGIGVVKIGDIQNGEITTSSISRVNKNVVNNLDDLLKIDKGDLVIAMSGATTGKLGFNKTNEVFYLNQRVGKIVPYYLNINYLFYPLTTKIAENLAKSMEVQFQI